MAKLLLTDGSHAPNSPSPAVSYTIGSVSFTASFQSQRPGLAQDEGHVYAAWGSHCDYFDYNGCVAPGC